MQDLRNVTSKLSIMEKVFFSPSWERFWKTFGIRKQNYEELKWKSLPYTCADTKKI